MARTWFPRNTRKVMVAFSDLFNKIKVLDKSGNEFTVPLHISTTEKLLQYLQKSGTLGAGRKTRITLPVMGFDITSLDPDEDRMMKPINKIFQGSSNKYVFQPIPYNWTIDLGIFADRASVLYDIIEQIVPYFHKARYYPLIDFKFKDGSYIQRDLAIELQAVPLDIQAIDIGEEDEKTYKATLSFMVKGWIYGYNKTLDTDSFPYISLVGSNTGNNPETSSNEWTKIEEWVSTLVYNNGDYVTYNGSVYQSTAGSNNTTPGETGSDWTFISTVIDLGSWSSSTTYAVDDIKNYPALGIIEWINVDFENEYNKVYEQLQITSDGTSTIVGKL